MSNKAASPLSTSADGKLETSEDASKTSGKWVYPYIMWAECPREVVEIRKGELAAHIGKGAFIQHPDPLTPSGQLTEGCRRSLLMAAYAYVRTNGGILTIMWGLHGFSNVGLDENGGPLIQSILVEVAGAKNSH